MELGRLPEACAKLGEAHRLSAGIGALFNLAQCQQRRGLFASAWTNYRSVAHHTRLAGQPLRTGVAEARAAELEAKLTRLVIEVDAPVEGLTVTREGVVIRPPEFGTALPVDPGPYRIAATAPGHLPWRLHVDAREPGRIVVRVPRLRPASNARDNGHLVAGVAVTSVGIAGIAVGAVAGVVALETHDDQKPFCRGDACTAEGVEINSDARNAGVVSTVGFGVGVAGLVAGVVTLVTVPELPDDAFLVPTVTGTQVGLVVGGTF